eukprot:scaffold18275_cov65-Phaeocystis_antarctica.AAC.3
MPAISSKPPKAGTRVALGTAGALAPSAPRPLAPRAGWGVARPSGVMPVLRQSARASAMSLPQLGHSAAGASSGSVVYAVTGGGGSGTGGGGSGMDSGGSGADSGGSSGAGCMNRSRAACEARRCSSKKTRDGGTVGSIRTSSSLWGITEPT